MLILKHADVAAVLRDREEQVVKVVRDAYLAHDRGKTSLPHSTFLRFPGNHGDRIIALPAFVDDGVRAAGVKWIASFPGNLGKGIPRASAVVTINSPETGVPEAFLEGSIISASRTAAGAALAAHHLAGGFDTLGVVGAGPIAFETVRYIMTTTAARAEMAHITIFDINVTRARAFAEQCNTVLGVSAAPVTTAAETLAARLVVFATTSSVPHVPADVCFSPGSTVLHISLRDLPPELILRHRNFVDDFDHVNREATSIHLTTKLTGDSSFVRGTLADVMAGKVVPRESPEEVVIYSPFGLGILDIALAKMVLDEARRAGLGIEVPDFASQA